MRYWDLEELLCEINLFRQVVIYEKHRYLGTFIAKNHVILYSPNRGQLRISIPFHYTSTGHIVV